MFSIKHIPGKQNPTDILSRMPLMNMKEKTRLKTEEFINEISEILVRYARPGAISISEIEEAVLEDVKLKL